MRGLPATGRGGSIIHSVIQGLCLLRPGPHLEPRTNEGIPTEVGTAAVKLSRKCPYRCVQGAESREFRMVWFEVRYGFCTSSANRDPGETVAFAYGSLPISPKLGSRT